MNNKFYLLKRQISTDDQDILIRAQILSKYWVLWIDEYLNERTYCKKSSFFLNRTLINWQNLKKKCIKITMKLLKSIYEIDIPELPERTLI